MRVVVVGAGISGLSCAKALISSGLPMTIRILERSNRVGGRMNTSTNKDDSFDTGAQFFTVRSAAFQAQVDILLEAGVVDVWCRGFADNADGYPRYKGIGGMSRVCEYLYGRMKNDVSLELNHNVVDVKAIKDTDYIVHTAPYDGVSYGKTLCVQVVLNQDTKFALRPPGALQRPREWPHIHFMADERQKGNASSACLTIHATPEFSDEHWEAQDHDIVVKLLPLDVRKDAVVYSVKRWPKAIPLNMMRGRFHKVGNVIHCGDAFTQMGVEGSWLSGLAGAQHIVDAAVRVKQRI